MVDLLLFLFHPLKPSSNCYRSLLKNFMQPKNLNPLYLKRLIFYLSRPSEHAVSAASPSKELIFGSATEDSQNSGSHKDQGKISAVSLGIKVKIVAFATHRIVTQCSEKPFMQASIIALKSLLFIMNFKCYTFNQKFTEWVKPLKHAVETMSLYLRNVRRCNYSKQHWKTVCGGWFCPIHILQGFKRS